MDAAETRGAPSSGSPLAPWSALPLLVVGPAAAAAAMLSFRAQTSRYVDLLSAGAAGTPAAVAGVVGGRAGEYVATARLAWLPVAGFLVFTLTASHLGQRVLWTARAREAAHNAAIYALLAGLSALVGTLVLLGMLDASVGRDGAAAARMLQAFTITAAATGIVAGATAVVAWAVTARRLVRHAWRQVRPRDVMPADAVFSSPVSVAAPTGSATTRWDNARRVPPDRPPAEAGICASGGGIRSACLTLGALQALAEEGELARARYLVSVSGGGYAAGAFQLALQWPPAGTDPGDTENVATRADVFRPGSAEEDHVRRHSNYIADNPREWGVALAVLLRGVVISITIMLLVVAAAGLAVGAFYAAVPLVDLDALRPRFALVRPDLAPAAPDFPAIPAGARLAVGVLLGAAVLLFLIEVAILSILSRHAPALSRIAWVLFGTALLTGLVGLAVPALVWASARVTWTVPVTGRVSTATAGALTTVLLTYVGTLIGVLWRKRETIGRRVGTVRGWLAGDAGRGAGQRAVPSSLLQRLVVFAVLLALGLLFLIVLGWVASTASGWPWWGYAVVLGGLAFCATLLDQTWLGLHPFYRRRLASAFAVRRLGDGTGAVRAQPYDFLSETTRLSHYGKRPETNDFPQVIFAAAANLSGSDRTPPGRRAVSYTFSSDYVGGPDLGWVYTEALEKEVGGHLQRDLTVQAAMAISGAAFASAMGRQARAFQTFFALSNARLGAWLPNPAFLAQQVTGPDWTRPQLPWVRRLSYLLREIVGRYPCDNRLLFCTDGGHYENLGLVELLRHGCRTVYCIDASGDAPPLATTLSEAITLAREELGVEITLQEPLDLIPGSADPLRPTQPLAALNSRLSRHAVRIGKIVYPRVLPFENGPPGNTGTLVVLKASLTGDLPYDLLGYAAKHPVFPRDSTSDQWFDHGQFNGYQTLGRELGKAAVRAARAVGAAPAAGPASVPEQPRSGPAVDHTVR